MLYSNGNQINPSAGATLAAFPGITLLPIPTGGTFAYAACRVRLFLTSTAACAVNLALPTSTGLVNAIRVNVDAQRCVALDLGRLQLTSAAIAVDLAAAVTGEVYAYLSVEREDGVAV